MSRSTTSDAATDPRPRLAASLDQLEVQVDAVTSGDLDRPTPCGEYDVRTLLGHVLAVVRKLDVAGRGGDASAVTDPADDVGGGWGEVIRRARAQLDRVWADDAALQRDCVLPWATMPGREVLDAYTHEFTVHAWDLAWATGRVGRLDPVLAETALDWFSRNLPAKSRTVGGAFGPVVAVADDADAYTRLAGFVGRDLTSGGG